jgi:hypothetical protein
MVKNKKGNKASPERIGQQGVSLQANHKEVGAKDQHRQNAKAGGESIYAVYQVK